MILDARQVDWIRGIAHAIHQAVIARHGTTQGQCKAASAALAMVLAPLGEPVALCHGSVEHEGEHHGHVWCRIGHTLIDSTADQFGQTVPLVRAEAECSTYREDGFVLFSPSEARALLEVAEERIHP